MTLQVIHGASSDAQTAVTTFQQLEQPLVALSGQSAEFAEFFEKMKGLVTALAEQNIQLELAVIASQSRIDAIDVLGTARTEGLKGRVTDLQDIQTSLETYRTEEKKKGEKDLGDILESQKTAVKSIEFACAAKAEAAQQFLRTKYRIELPKRIQEAKDNAKRKTEGSCREKFALQEKALVLKQQKEIRKVIDATRERLDQQYRYMNNCVIPKVTEKRDYYLKYHPTSVPYGVADAAWRGASYPAGQLFPNHFSIPGFDMSITND